MCSSSWKKSMQKDLSSVKPGPVDLESKAAEEQTVFISFNKSENPFAYLRTEEDVNRFVTNIRKTAGEKGINRFLQFMWIITMYLVKNCSPLDRSIATMLKVVKEACQPVTKGEYKLTFEFMVEDTKDASLLEKFELFKTEMISFDSSTYQKIYQDSVAFLSSVQDKDLLKNLGYLAYPTQAVLREGNTEYELWFTPSASNKVKAEYYGCDTFEVFLPSVFFDDNAMQEFGIFHDRKPWNLNVFIFENLKGLLNLVKRSMTVGNSGSVRKDFTDLDEDFSMVRSLFDDIPSKRKGQSYQAMLQEKPEFAVHEAGHAVAHYLLGHEMVGASLHRIKDTGGWVRLADSAFLDPNERAIASYAGFAATKLICGVENYYGCGEDFLQATSVIKEAVQEEAKKQGIAQQLLYIDADELGLADQESPYVVAETIRRCMDCYERAFDLIEQHKSLVDLLAMRLLQKEAMTGAEIKAFCDEFCNRSLLVPESLDLTLPDEVQEEYP